MAVDSCAYNEVLPLAEPHEHEDSFPDAVGRHSV